MPEFAKQLGAHHRGDAAALLIALHQHVTLSDAQRQGVSVRLRQRLVEHGPGNVQSVARTAELDVRDRQHLEERTEHLLVEHHVGEYLLG